MRRCSYAARGLSPVELVVHADLGDRKLVREVRVDGHRNRSEYAGVDREGLVLLVELDVVVLDERGPVLGDHPLGAETDQPAPGGAFLAGDLGQATTTEDRGRGHTVGGVHPGG